MMLHFGILMGQDDMIEHGDYITDPFNVLGVTYIDTYEVFVELLKCLDYNKLINSTTNFNYDEWESTSNVQFYSLLYSKKTQEIIARFAWWICHQVLYEQREKRIIDCTDIFYDDCLYNQLRLYIYTCNVIENVISVDFLDNKEPIRIKFKNIENL